MREILEDPSEYDIENNASRNTHSSDLQYSNRVALLRHAGKTSSAAFQVRGEGGEYVALSGGRFVSYISRQPCHGHFKCSSQITHKHPCKL